MSRHQVLRSALSVFSRRGYSGTTLREIATEVGIKPPSIYAHYASKEALFSAVYAWVTEEHSAHFREVADGVAGLPPLERLHRVLGSVDAYYRERPELVDFYLRAAVDQHEADQAGIHTIFMTDERHLSEVIRDAYTDGRDRGDFADHDPEAFTAFFLCLMDGLFLQLKHYTPTQHAERFALTWRQLSAMLSPAPRSHP